MRSAIAALLLLAVSAFGAWGGDPAPGPASVQVDTLRVTMRPLTAGAPTLKCSVSGNRRSVAFSPVWPDGKPRPARWTIGVPSGATVPAELLTFDGSDFSEHWYLFTVAVTPPQPTPDPQPGPVPPTPTPDPPGPPVPVPSGPLCVLVLEESSQRTPMQALLYGSPVLRKYLAASGDTWNLVDKDTLDPAGQPAWAWATKRAKSLPWMIVFRDKGPIYSEGALPPTMTADELVAILKKLRGG